ncbi:UDP-N-acetylmuramoyl-L-alanyl-D-glutamate--2,6-diaminopimelate ligase [Virgibacillus siamensis]|uniref:UDP-N-acetylmuramoyl-L-alanyl-D-glutamate--2, 6-diaminopimelate ligase n=1 Tax=Virgibacillus siamensis TaxID=480071 RepID=UPI000986617B|nr:UDP-N-acetylmuramoyl-L-alanyl-D-glutamate--2,6-diaminopimelate ligase [Virgibacillus siamensis]
MKLSELLSELAFYETNAPIEDVEIRDIEMDSREVQAGDLFICIDGFTVDGHDFAEQAVQNGASAILAEKELAVSIPVVKVASTSRAMAMIAGKFYDYPTKHFPLIGVTGTNGKTTVTYLLESIFNQFNRKTGLIGTIQMKIGEAVYPVKNTTPDALFLQRTFKQMRDEQIDQGIMEVSSHALDLGRVHGCDFDVAVFTNISQDHLDYHHSMEEYLHAKSLLFAQLGNGYGNGKKKYAVINLDDPHSDILIRSTAQQVITYGCEKDAQVMAEDINLEVTKTSFKLVTPVGSVQVNSKLVGKFNIYNMLAASAAAIAANVPLSAIKDALEQVKGVSGRFQPVEGDHDFAVIVDYAHTPDSLENVLETIKGFAKKKVYVVVGCGGDRDKTKRPLMADIAMNYADHVVFTSDNPRTENPSAILDDMTEGLKGTHYEVIESRKDAITTAVKQADTDDIVLIAGKGHETYQEIDGVRHDFDDREEAKQAIDAKENL